MTLIHAYQGLGTTRNIVILDANGDTITPTSNDEVRATIGREGQTPKLTVTSGSPTANGSSFTKGAINILRLDASDLEFDPGTYTLSIEFFDADDANEFKMVEKQVFTLEGVV